MLRSSHSGPWSVLLSTIRRQFVLERRDGIICLSLQNQYMGKKRIESEKRTVRLMISLYCRHHHGGKELCGDCQSLMDYCASRLDHCKFGEKKTACKKCPVHCYKPDMREKIRSVMRFSGPRMILYHPVELFKHIFNL